MPAMRQIMANMLAAIGFTEVRVVSDGVEAWDLIRDSHADPSQAVGLVIADWNMGRMSGVELLRSVRAMPESRDLPFLLVTAEGDQEHLAEAAQSGVSGYIVKPFMVDQFEREIRRVLMGR